MNCLYILEVIPLLVTLFENIFFCLIPIAVPHSFVNFCFYFHYSVWWIQKKSCCDLCQGVLYISSKSFIVFSLTFRSFFHFQFIFVYGILESSNFTLVRNSCPVFSVAFIEELVFSSLYILVSFVVDGLISLLSILFH